jgi:hypothetical protein
MLSVKQRIQNGSATYPSKYLKMELLAVNEGLILGSHRTESIGVTFVSANARKKTELRTVRVSY